MKHFHEFGSPCCILNDRAQRGKFDAKSDDGVFLIYYSNNLAYRVYNKRTTAVMESINAKVDDHLPRSSYPRSRLSIILAPSRFNSGGGQTLSVPKDVRTLDYVESD